MILVDPFQLMMALLLADQQLCLRSMDTSYCRQLTGDQRMPTWEQGINQKTVLGISKSPEEQQKCPVWILTPLLSQTE